MGPLECKKGCHKVNVVVFFLLDCLAVWLCVTRMGGVSYPIPAYFIQADLLQNCGDHDDDHEDDLVMITMIFLVMRVMILLVMTTVTTV